MSDIIEPTLWHKLRHTPMSDLVRGRASNRLDLRSRLREANLPSPAVELITRVVRRTRLWRVERIDVADELIAHFQDGVSSGDSIEHLVSHFGDEDTAAHLITRGKRRGRSPIFKALGCIGWLLVAMLALYAISGAMFFLGKPHITVDYLAEQNSSVESVPVDQRAWPIYRQALLAIGGEPDKNDREWNRKLDARPGSKHWPEMREWLAKHEHAIALVVEGSSKPAMGFVVGPNGSANDPELWPKIAAQQKDVKVLSDITLPHLNALRTLANVVASDCAAARERKDTKRVVRDMDTLLNLANQMHDSHAFLIGDFVAIHLWQRALSEIEETIETTPQLLTDADLHHFADRISGPTVAGDLISFETERTVFYDAIQRSYTDDGQGDGRLTRDALPVFRRITGTHADAPLLETLAAAAGPALAASRRDVVKFYDDMMDRAEANLQLPMRDANWDSWTDKVLGKDGSLAFQLRYLPVSFLMPALSHSQQSAERVIGRRDGVITGVALALFHRRNDRYPTTLSELAPEFLPSVPSDRINGEPLRYRLVDGKPLVYSVGVDRDDDWGRSAVGRDGSISTTNAAIGNSAASPQNEGDWLLYPQPKSPPIDDD